MVDLGLLVGTGRHPKSEILCLIITEAQKLAESEQGACMNQTLHQTVTLDQSSCCCCHMVDLLT